MLILGVTDCHVPRRHRPESVMTMEVTKLVFDQPVFADFRQVFAKVLRVLLRSDGHLVCRTLYMAFPDEHVLENMLVREGHIQCAAYEMPIRPEQDAQYFGKDLPKICEDRLVKDELGYFHCHDRFRPMPARYVAIRDTEDEHFAIIDVTLGRNVVLEELEASRVFFTIY